MRLMSLIRSCFFASGCVVLLCAAENLASAQQTNPPSESDTASASEVATPPEPQSEPAAPAPQAQSTKPAKPVPPSRIEQLTELVEQLRSEILLLRQELAQSELDRAAAQREADELRQFIEDHRQYGDDFQRYRAVVEIAEREAKQRAAEAAKQRREAERLDRESRRRAAALERNERESEQMRVARYRRAGFSPLGLDVFTSRMSYFYETRDATRTRVAYDPLFGPYTKVSTSREVDYSSMTISGSILNASTETRNIGVAIAFFDERGNQVGHETIQISNARPDVPYPFTSTISMALDRPFESSSLYVMYADPIEAAD